MFFRIRIFLFVWFTSIVGADSMTYQNTFFVVERAEKWEVRMTEWTNKKARKENRRPRWRSRRHE